MQHSIASNQDTSTDRFKLALYLWAITLLLELIGRKMSFSIFEVPNELSLSSTLLTFSLLWCLYVGPKWLNINFIALLSIYIRHRSPPHQMAIFPVYVHWYIGDLISVVIIVSTFYLFVKNRKAPTISCMDRICTPFLMIILLVNLTAAGFSKLNTDFMNPNTSLSTYMYDLFNESFPVFRLPNLIRSYIPLIVFVTECISPILLLFRPTRIFASISIVILMCIIGTTLPRPLKPYNLFEFCGLFVSLLVLFSPHSNINTFKSTILTIYISIKNKFLAQIHPDRIPNVVSSLKIIVYFVVISFIFSASLSTHDSIRIIGTRVIWCVICLMVIAISIIPIKNNLNTHIQIRNKSSLVNLPYVFFALLLITKESLFYLGAGIYPSLTMASGLEVNRAYSNHLLIQKIPHLYINQIVKVVDSNDPFLIKGAYYSIYPLDTYLNAHPNIYAKLSMNDKEINIPNTDLKFFNSLIKFPNLFFSVHVCWNNSSACKVALNNYASILSQNSKSVNP